MPLHLALAIGAASAGVITLIVLFSTSLISVPDEIEGPNAKMHFKALVKRRNRAAAIGGIIAVVFVVIFVLT